MQEPRGHRSSSHTASNLDVLSCPWLSVPTVQDQPGFPAHLPHNPGPTWMSCPRSRTHTTNQHSTEAASRQWSQEQWWIPHQTRCPPSHSLHLLTPLQRKSQSQPAPQSHSGGKGEQLLLPTTPSLQDQQFPAQGSKLQLRNRHGEGMSNPNPQGCQ